MPPANPHPNAAPGSGAYTNAPQVAAELVAVGPRAQRKAISRNKHHAMLLQTRVKAKASGRPGPRARSGNYRRTWTTVGPYLSGSDVESTVGTNAPQGRRLEHGFVGPDRLGRVYNQPPYPHLGPAVAETEPDYVADMASIVSWSDS